jgi:hypothetical protein
MLTIAAQLGVGSGTVQRVKRELAASTPSGSDSRPPARSPSCRVPLQRIVKARTVHGAYGAEMRVLDEDQRHSLELVK